LSFLADVGRDPNRGNDDGAGASLLTLVGEALAAAQASTSLLASLPGTIFACGFATSLKT
jgi:hypothetical protein